MCFEIHVVKKIYVLLKKLTKDVQWIKMVTYEALKTQSSILLHQIKVYYNVVEEFEECTLSEGLKLME